MEKKSSGSTWIIVLLLIVSVALVFSVIYFFILKPSENAEKANTVTEKQTEQTTAAMRTSMPETTSISEEIIVRETPKTEPEIIEIITETVNTANIETTGPIIYESLPKEKGFYAKASINGIVEDFVAFMDADENIQLRVYGTRWKKVNNVNQEKMTGYFTAEIKSHSSGSAYLEVTGAAPLTPENEHPAIPDRNGANLEGIRMNNEKYHKVSENLYVCVTKTNEVMYRTFARVGENTYLFDCDRNGNIAIGSMPIVIEEEEHNLTVYADSYHPDTDTYVYVYPVRYNKTKYILTVNK